jgi:hypothetical protein
MSGSTDQVPEQVLRAYFRAKDQNRPHLIDSVFRIDAVLEMHVNTEDISFPAIMHGRAAIADVLVSNFARTYENIYSFYLERPTSAVTQFSCGWLVGMSEKNGGRIRVGCGRYDWRFQDGRPQLASHLVITITAMKFLPPQELDATLGWLQRLSYPWSSAAEILAVAPPNPALSEVLQYVGRHGA